MPVAIPVAHGLFRAPFRRLPDHRQRMGSYMRTCGWLRFEALAPHAFTLPYAPLLCFLHARASRFALVSFPLTIADLGHS